MLLKPIKDLLPIQERKKADIITKNMPYEVRGGVSIAGINV